MKKWMNFKPIITDTNSKFYAYALWKINIHIDD